MKHFLLVLLIISVEAFPQSFTINNYQITIENNSLEVLDSGGESIIQMMFSNPSGFIYDLDGDTSEELIIIDSSGNSSKTDYTLYLFNTIEPFFLVDSISSGSIQPYYTLSDEIGEVILVTGNDRFSYLDEENKGYLPLNCWKFDAGELYEINDEIYDLFISENDALVAVIDEYFNSNINNCAATEKMKSIMAAAYVNYINASEQSLAFQFLKNYYLCDDLEEFKNKIDELILN